jgi:Zn-dependent protease
MFKTLYLGTLQGARIYIHWSFWILAIFVFFSGLGNGFSQALAMLGFVLAVFACVFLHELGHAVAAKAFGHSTRDITLLPIGGVARIEGGEMNPVAEGWVAIAGPAVNLAIALALTIGSSISAIGRSIDAEHMIPLTPTQQLIIANLALAIFNLVPAFPLDGGRVLRSLLCYWFDRPRATQIASRVGQWASGGLILTSIVWWNFMGILFGIILYLVNTAQRFQSHFRVEVGGMGQAGTFQYGPFQQGPFGRDPFARDPLGNDSFRSVGSDTEGNTVDAIEVREVPR